MNDEVTETEYETDESGHDGTDEGDSDEESSSEEYDETDEDDEVSVGLARPCLNPTLTILKNLVANPKFPY